MIGDDKRVGGPDMRGDDKRALGIEIDPMSCKPWSATDGEHMRALGIDIGGSSVKMGLLDQEGGVADITKADTIIGDPEAMADLICGNAARYTPDIVGVGTAGMVNHKSGLVTASNLKWTQVALRKMLEDRLHVPVWVDNDAQAAMMAEAHSGVLEGARCAVYITLGTGVGGALLIDGRPWRGNDNAAFELGHIVTHANGVLCACGMRGCFESYASTPALSRIGGGKSARKIIDGVLAGAPEDIEIFDIYIHELCVGLFSVINLFRPDAIALGGGASAAGEALINGVNKEIEKLFPARRDDYKINIKLAAHKNNAGMIGAAALAKLHLL